MNLALLDLKKLPPSQLAKLRGTHDTAGQAAPICTQEPCHASSSSSASASAREGRMRSPASATASADDDAAIAAAAAIAASCVRRVELPGLGGGAVVVLVGTAHVSRRSVRQVADVVKDAAPHAVVVELCRQRTPILFMTEASGPQSLRKTLRLLRQHGIFPVLYSHVLASVAARLDALPGAEFQAALLAAVDVQQQTGRNVLFCLGDRPLGITVGRLWGSLSIFQRFRLCIDLLRLTRVDMGEKELNQLMSQSGVDGAMQELERKFPALRTALVLERNRFLAASLRDVALAAARKAQAAERSVGQDEKRTCSMCGVEFPSRSAMFQHIRESKAHSAPEDTSRPLPAVTIVGVLDCGHLKGVQELLESASLNGMDTVDLMTLPAPGPSANVIMLRIAATATGIAALCWAWHCRTSLGQKLTDVFQLEPDTS